MSSTPPIQTTSTENINPTPLLSNSGSRHNLRGAARFLRRASSRSMNLREPSVLVRETAAEQLEERQSDWAYSKPVVVLDIIWNIAFVVCAFTVLGLSRNEKADMPLRLWILGYVFQCVVHMVCVVVEFRRRRRSAENVLRSGEYVSLSQLEGESSASVAKHLESANTMFSFVWWIIGFYWVSTGGQVLADNSPQLYWLCITFLGFDVFFVVFCVALACVIGIAVCCCLPCIIAVLYAVSDREGASDEDIDQLAKYNFRKFNDNEKVAADVQGPVVGIMTECGTDSPIEHALSEEDAECCICLSAYEDGIELRELPCRHHFHCACIVKWLHISATCPLCKYNILKSTYSREEV